ncbi:hypothetical protein CBR_g31889 [Chara braunii]|uniref:EGF-like domain-containing protein n=1 Tax=Chara braunii TaxID=69332 RepID=A0A388LG25_CHABU|nr:hypothetical protein CBR_g31889 [Chara braunii]|eukprot:GBG81217.1 hypothetical protein CBR_g31889 [Chara braunii]
MVISKAENIRWALTASEAGLKKTINASSNSTKQGLMITTGVIIQEVDSVVRQGVCGNGMCEVGERCTADGTSDILSEVGNRCCPSDCPYVPKACPVPTDGPRKNQPCAGNGRCLDSTGTCDCFYGHTGRACSRCVDDWTMSPGGFCVRMVDTSAVDKFKARVSKKKKQKIQMKKHNEVPSAQFTSGKDAAAPAPTAAPDVDAWDAPDPPLSEGNETWIDDDGVAGPGLMLAPISEPQGGGEVTMMMTSKPTPQFMQVEEQLKYVTGVADVPTSSSKATIATPSPSSNYSPKPFFSVSANDAQELRPSPPRVRDDEFHVDGPGEDSDTYTSSGHPVSPSPISPTNPQASETDSRETGPQSAPSPQGEPLLQTPVVGTPTSSVLTPSLSDPMPTNSLAATPSVHHADSSAVIVSQSPQEFDPTAHPDLEKSEPPIDKPEGAGSLPDGGRDNAMSQEGGISPMDENEWIFPGSQQYDGTAG